MSVRFARQSNRATSERLRATVNRGSCARDVRLRKQIALVLVTLSGCSDKRLPDQQPIPATSSPIAAFSPTSLPTFAPAVSAAPAASVVLDSRLSPTDEARFDTAIHGAMERNEIPGAVLVVVRHGEMVFRRAYGFRAKDPAEVRMTLDTLFDLASLTKPLATATSILVLAERGVLRIQDPVKKWLPAFRGEPQVTIEHLLRHTAGLPPGSAAAKQANSREKALERIIETPPEHAPGEMYVYSDVGYILLGEIVEKASNEALDVFAKKNIFAPLGMRDTMFRPPAALVGRIAPTTREGDEMLVGKVHDPTSRALGGLAGHAGLFSTADDVSRFVTALMHKGELDGKAVLSPTIVKQLLNLQSLPSGNDKRSLGLVSMFEGVGHTGFTGTAFWIAPVRDHAVILLTNAVHPDGQKNAKQVRKDVASAAILMGTNKPTPPAASKNASVRTGIDVLEQSDFGLLDGRRIGLITNHTGKNARGERTIDVLIRQDKLALLALFTPEHGLTGTADGAVGHGKDPTTTVPIYSLYGKDKRPSDAAFTGLDTLVFDIQDAGTRFYTYITTLGYMLEEAAKRKLRFVVLDRPNPLGGVVMEGPLLDADRESFVGYHEIPIRHGMTVGELARMYNAERKLGADLHVVAMDGYTRSMLWSGTGLSWIAPSPNLRSPTEALLYPGVGLLETTNLSVGRGTDQPFERLGAPYIDENKLAQALNQANIPGVRFSPLRFTPKENTFAKEECGGVSIQVTQANVFQPVRMGLIVAITLRKLYPSDWKVAGIMTLLGNAQTFGALNGGESIDAIVKAYEKDLAAFASRRGPFLLYP